MTNIQPQGVHHLTFVGSNREATIEFYQDFLGMPLVFEQPNLDVPEETHLYFDPGDGRLITIFVRPTRQNDPTPNPPETGNLHHIAFNVSRATFTQIAGRLQERNNTIADVLGQAHRLRLEAGDYAIGDKHLADALVMLSERAVPASEPLQPM